MLKRFIKLLTTSCVRKPEFEKSDGGRTKNSVIRTPDFDSRMLAGAAAKLWSHWMRARHWAVSSANRTDVPSRALGKPFQIWNNKSAIDLEPLYPSRLSRGLARERRVRDQREFRDPDGVAPQYVLCISRRVRPAAEPHDFGRRSR